MMDFKIIEADERYADSYRVFCQKAYQQAYPRPELGITEDLFSKEVFDSEFVRNYFDGLFDIDDLNKIWLAVNEKGEILGGIGAKKNDDHVEMKAFYVAIELKGRGIGGKLYEKVLNFAGDMPIWAWVYEYLDETINMYRHWGFELDKSKGKLEFDWEPWTKEVKMSAICMIKSGNKSNK